MIFSINIYNVKSQNKVTIYHKNVLTREHHEFSMIVFHGIEIVFPYWFRDFIHSDANP